MITYRFVVLVYSTCCVHLYIGTSQKYSIKQVGGNIIIYTCSKSGAHHCGRDLIHTAHSRDVGLPADWSSTLTCPWSVMPHPFDVPHPVCLPCLLCFGNTLKQFKSLLDGPGNATFMPGSLIRDTRSWQGSGLLLGCPWSWKPPRTAQSNNHAQTCQLLLRPFHQLIIFQHGF